MKFIFYLTLFCFGTLGLLASFGFVNHVTDLFYGMFAPWLVGILTIYLMKTHVEKGKTLTNMMISAFVGKMIFYGLYFSIIFKFYSFHKVTFIFSFTGYFILLHIIETVYFRSIIKNKQTT